MVENSKGRERPNFVQARIFGCEGGKKLVNEHQQPKSLFEGLWSWGVYRRQQNVESETTSVIQWNLPFASDPNIL